MIQTEKLSVQFKKKIVLDHVDLTMENGRIYGLLGKNGEGKTTLLRVISGLLFPHSGKCFVNGFIPKKRKMAFLDQMYIIPEELVLPVVTVQKYFDIYSPFYSSFSAEILSTCVEAFGIDKSVRLDKLSMGERKKVAISFAFAANTRVLLMDEPTNGLDIPSKSVFRKLMAALMTDDRCVIISTHQVRDLDSLIDSVLILDRQKILLNAGLSEISEKLAFKKIENGEECLYVRKDIPGQVGVTLNVDKRETAVDLELLFETVVNCPDEIKRIFV